MGVNDMAADDEGTLRERLVHEYRRTAELQLNELASGNLSVRCRDGMLISPTGATAENFTPERAVFVGLDGTWADGARPSSEWQMHVAVYRQHEDTRAVVHTHSDHCVAVSCFHRPLPGFHYLVGVFGGTDVPCTPYTTFGGAQLADDAAAALRNRRACLLGSHGMLAHAGSLRTAVDLAHRLEILCRQYLLARTLGEPYLLNEREWNEFFERSASTRYGG